MIWCPLRRCVLFFILSKNNANSEREERERETETEVQVEAERGSIRLFSFLFVVVVVVRFQSFITASLLMVSEKDERRRR